MGNLETPTSSSNKSQQELMIVLISACSICLQNFGTLRMKWFWTKMSLRFPNFEPFDVGRTLIGREFRTSGRMFFSANRYEEIVPAE